MKCLDTDFLVAVLRGEPKAKKLMLELSEGEGLATTAITAFELYFGAERSAKRFENVLATTSLLNGLKILEFDVEAAKKAARLQASLISGGKSIGSRDVYIAATCITAGCSLLTMNKKHFLQIPELKLE